MPEPDKYPDPALQPVVPANPLVRITLPLQNEIQRLVESFSLSAHQFCVVDSSTILSNPHYIFENRNGKEPIGVITDTVFEEISKKFKKGRFRKQKLALAELIESRRYVITGFDPKRKDNLILSEVIRMREAGLAGSKFITADRLLAAQAKALGIETVFHEPEYVPPKAISYTGFLEQGSPGFNYFYWNNAGQPVFHGADGDRVVETNHAVWNLLPRTVYQNLALDLMISDIPIVTIQSEAGYGKSRMALAAAIYLVFQAKKYKKIILIKPAYDASNPQGYLPGNMKEKTDPFLGYAYKLIFEITRERKAKDLFMSDGPPYDFNPERFEVMHLNYMRSVNIDGAVVVFDESQNADKGEGRALFTRNCQNVKLICLGDVTQIDRDDIDDYDCALNRAVRKFAGNENYAHLVLQGETERGPICDLVIKTGY
jgi:PhoH-like ATPase